MGIIGGKTDYLIQALQDRPKWPRFNMDCKIGAQPSPMRAVGLFGLTRHIFLSKKEGIKKTN